MKKNIFFILFVLFYWLKLANNSPISLLEGGGGGGEVAVNFGDSEFGSGDNFSSTEAVTPPQATPEEVTEAEILAANAAHHGLIGQVYNSVSTAYAAARANAAITDFIYIGGSTFVVAEIL